MNKLILKIVIVATVIVSVFVITVCGVQQAVVRNITPKEAYDMMNEIDEFVLLDVRNASEFASGRIYGAINIPYTDLTMRAVNEISNKKIVILVYCQTGRRSAHAAANLVGLGFLNVYDFGGINNWPFGITR